MRERRLEVGIARRCLVEIKKRAENVELPHWEEWNSLGREEVEKR